MRPRRTKLAYASFPAACFILLLASSAETQVLNANREARAAKVEVIDDYGRLPLAFEINEGQADSRARFLARRGGSAIYLMPGAARIIVTHVPREADAHEVTTGSKRTALKPDSAILEQLRVADLTIQFVGARPTAEISGEDRLSGTANYFIGKDASQWRSRIPTYRAVRYGSIYPGIDAIFYGTGRKLEYDLVVSPGADPARVRLAFEGAQGLKLKSNGDLVANAGTEQVVLHAPMIYQLDGARRESISGGFIRLTHNQIGIRLAAYDRARPIVIDPTVTYATYVSGSSFDLVNWSAIDNTGDQYLTGMTCSGDFPVAASSITRPEYQSTYGGACDAFVTVLNNTGTGLIYSTYLGGDQFDEGNGIAVDGSGAAYVVGETAGDFPIAPLTPVPAFQSTDPGLPIEGFAAKLSSDGSTLVYSSYLGGSSVPASGFQDRAFSVAVPQGCTSGCNAYVTGQTPTCDFPTTAGVVQNMNAGYSASGAGCASSATNNLFDAYVAEFSSDGTALVYSTYLGGKGGDWGGAIGVDTSGDAFVTGLSDAYAGPASLPTSSGAAQPNFGGTADAFVVELDPTGAKMVYSTFLGGSGYDSGQDITLDGVGDAYVVGYTYSIDFPIWGSSSLEPASPLYLSGWLAELNKVGRPVFSTYVGNLSSQPTERVALDSQNNIYVDGWTNAPDAFQPVNPVQLTPQPAGSVLHSTDNGATFHDSGFPLDVGSAGTHDIAVDPSTSPEHTIYVATLRSGLFVSTDDGNTFTQSGFNGFVGNVSLDTNTTPATLYFESYSGLMSAVGLTVSPTSITTPVTLLGVDTTVKPSAIYVWRSGLVPPWPGQIEVSTDGGQTFTTTIEMPAGTEPYSIAHDPNSGTLYLGTNHGVLASSGGGAFAQTGMNFSPAYQVIVDYNINPSIIYAGTVTQGVVWSADGFKTVNFPLGLFFGDVQALDLDRTATPATLYIGSSNGVFISSDGGQTYQTTNLGGDNPDVTSIAIDSGLPNGIFASLFLDTVASVSELSTGGSSALFSSLIGGSEVGFSRGLGVSSNGSIYMTGGTYAHDFPTTPNPGAFQLASSAQLSGFAVNISNTGVSAGADQMAAPNGATTVTGDVSSAGTTSATTSDSSPNPLPAGYTQVSQYTSLTTSATYTGLITICLNYNPSLAIEAADLSLLHFQEGQWANITTSINMEGGVICGQASSLSPFVIATGNPCSTTYTGKYRGNLNVSGRLTCIENGTVTGAVQGTGSVMTSDVTIGKNLNLIGGSFSIGSGSTIDGNLKLERSPAGGQDLICGAKVRGNVLVQQDAGAVTIGSKLKSCPGNRISGNLQVTNNTGGVNVFNNVAKGDLQCRGNSSASGGGNRAARKEGECAKF